MKRKLGLMITVMGLLLGTVSSVQAAPAQSQYTHYHNGGWHAHNTSEFNRYGEGGVDCVLSETSYYVGAGIRFIIWSWGSEYIVISTINPTLYNDFPDFWPSPGGIQIRNASVSSEFLNEQTNFGHTGSTQIEFTVVGDWRNPHDRYDPYWHNNETIGTCTVNL